MGIKQALAHVLTNKSTLSNELCSIFGLRNKFDALNLWNCGLIFDAPLKTSLVPDFAVDYTPTFTRATIATHVQPDGHIVETISGESRFGGARRVENVFQLGAVTNTDDFDNWNVVNATVSGNIITPTGTSGRIFWASALGTEAGKQYRYHLKVTPTKDGQICRITVDQVGGASTSTNVTLAEAGVEYWITSDVHTVDLASTNVRVIVYADFNVDVATLEVHDGQLEDVTGQTNQNPAEYVSKGILSTPYHGANVDGVKWFPTANGNTVASNIVTERTGAALTLNGLLMEPARTNIALHSEDLSNAAWVATNVTKGSTSVVAPDGLANTNVRLTAAAGNGTVLQTVTSASADRSYAVYMKRVTGTGNIDLTTDGGTTWTTKTLTSAWQRFDVQKSAVTNPQFGVRIVTSGDAIDFWGSQEEIGTYPSSYIATSGAAATRNIDVLSYPLANFNDADGSIYLEYTPIGDTGKQTGGGAAHQRLVSVALTNTNLAYVHVSNAGYAAFDGTGSASIYNNGVPFSGLSKIAISWETGGNRVLYYNGLTEATATQPFDGSWGPSGSIKLMGVGFISGNIGNLRLWGTPLSDAKKQSITTP